MRFYKELKTYTENLATGARLLDPAQKDWAHGQTEAAMHEAALIRVSVDALHALSLTPEEYDVRLMAAHHELTQVRRRQKVMLRAMGNVLARRGVSREEASAQVKAMFGVTLAVIDAALEHTRAMQRPRV